MVGRSTFLVLFGATSSLAIFSPRNSTDGNRIVIGSVAKYYPGDTRYPDVAAWQQLEQSLSTTGKLRRTALKWTGHYETALTPDCDAYASDWINDPFSIRTQWFAGFNCDACPAHYSQNTCNVGNLPPYVVEATSAKDVSAAVKFAANHNLRLVIKNTGHDFMGRNLGFGGLSVWTHKLRSPIKFTENWIPTVGNQDVAPQSAVTFGAGWQWRDVYFAAGAAGKFVTGGTDGSVGAGGGWLLGGGHGPFTNVWGLGSDNILELEVVLPSNGKIVVANEQSYPDLFWALRGGGGGTFGVVTKVTMKAHPQVSMNGIRVTVRPTVDIETDAGKAAWAKAMAFIMTSMPDINDFGISGHPIMLNSQFDTLWTAPGKSSADIGNFIGPYIDELKTTYGVSASYSNLPSSMLTMMTNLAMIPNAQIPNRDYEGPSIMASRLLGRKSLSNFAAVERAMRYLFDREYICEPFNVGGRAAADKNIRAGLNPSWRDSVIHFSILPTGQGDMDTVGKVKRGYANIEAAIKVLDGISENSGSYVNEGSWNEDNWQVTYWGSNYAKLSEVKRRYDPNNTLWCFPCVGAEIFAEQPDGKLYYYSTGAGPAPAGAVDIGSMSEGPAMAIAPEVQQAPVPEKSHASGRAPVPKMTARPQGQNPWTQRPQTQRPQTQRPQGPRPSAKSPVPRPQSPRPTASPRPPHNPPEYAPAEELEAQEISDEPVAETDSYAADSVGAEEEYVNVS